MRGSSLGSGDVIDRTAETVVVWVWGTGLARGRRGLADGPKSSWQPLLYPSQLKPKVWRLESDCFGESQSPTSKLQKSVKHSCSLKRNIHPSHRLTFKTMCYYAKRFKSFQKLARKTKHCIFLKCSSFLAQVENVSMAFESVEQTSTLRL